jgi:flagellar M-ring protein FliF
MDQIRRLWESLSLRQRISLGVAVLAVLGGLALLVRYQREQDFVVLFSGLAPEDAAAVMNRIKEKNAEYRLAENGSAVLVRTKLLNEMRLELAAAGMPKSERIGFDLFDRNNFGLTEFTAQVNYHRALEGEIERTIRTIAEIEQARVHITPPKDSVFEDLRRTAKASVLVKLRPMQKLAPNNVKAITHLVASAVEGLTPEAVSVLDIHGVLLTRPPGSENADEGLNQPLLLYKRNMERDLLAKVNATLEPLLGPDRFRAAVSVECDLSQTEQSEETFDPDASVMTTSQRSEETAVAQTAQGVPGVASNLPRPTSRPGGAGQDLNRRTENLNFQTSRLVKKTKMPQGNVRRVSVSVLLDHIRSEDLINLGAYVAGSNPQMDSAIRLRPKIVDFLRQRPDECSTPEDMLTRMEAIVGKT